MCYSSLVEKAYEEYVKMFNAPFQMDAFHLLYRQREIDLLLKIPSELDDILIVVDPINAGIIRESVRNWRSTCTDEIARLETIIDELEASLPKKATTEMKAPLKLAKSRRKSIQTALNSKPADGEAYRIYPKYFAPVILDENGERKTVPMRYRILPRTGVEVPDLYNVFNARRDSLTSARNWKPLFGKKHALFPMLKFFEWVTYPPTGKKMEMAFSPDGYQRMWAASLYEEYQHPEIGLIRSFAMVTDEPPPEVAAAGHDRCPVFIDENVIDAWLRPQGCSLEVLDALLGEKQPTYFSNARAA
jgi:putative SOS response-associated peptidase YedK